MRAGISREPRLPLWILASVAVAGTAAAAPLDDAIATVPAETWLTTGS